MDEYRAKIDEAVDRTVDYLGSAEALTSVDRDPYWPKWDSPWWRMTLLWEMGMAARVPPAIVQRIVAALNNHYLHHFPTKPEHIPPGKDPHRDFLCHCGLGTMFQVLSGCGVDMDRECPWAREWFLKYQLPDGGLNCDEAAYSKVPPKSSMLSTLPPLEAILYYTPRPYTPEEEKFLDAGAQYLIDHKLYRSLKTGGVIHEEWLEICFPRYYQYDILRGLSYLVDWAEKRRKPIPRRAIEEPLGLMRAKTRGRQLCAERVGHAGIVTLNAGGDGVWVKCDAETFELLDRVSMLGIANPWLTLSWNHVREVLGRGY